GRGRQAELTEAGEQMLVRAAPTHVRSVRDLLLDVIGHDDLLELGRILAKTLAEDAPVGVGCPAAHHGGAPLGCYGGSVGTVRRLGPRACSARAGERSAPCRPPRSTSSVTARCTTPSASCTDACPGTGSASVVSRWRPSWASTSPTRTSPWSAPPRCCEPSRPQRRSRSRTDSRSTPTSA